MFQTHLNSSRKRRTLMTSQLLCFRWFFSASSWEKDTKNGAAVTSLRSFLFRDDFNSLTFLTDSLTQITKTCFIFILKLSRNKKGLHDVTAAPFLVSFSQLPAAKKHRKRSSCDVIKVLLISWWLYYDGCASLCSISEVMLRIDTVVQSTRVASPTWIPFW